MTAANLFTKKISFVFEDVNPPIFISFQKTFVPSFTFVMGKFTTHQ
jgi:hypothetical protein